MPVSVLAKKFEEQLEEGQSYYKLHKAVTINVLDFNYIPTEKYHTTFHLREDTISDLWLTDLLEIHFVELRKLQEQSVGIERRLVRWMLFLTAKTKERLEELAMEEPVMQKALTTLEFLSQDKHTRELYEQRQKGLQTYAVDMEGAREEGKAEGKHLRARFTARNLLAMGMEVEAIARVTDLPILEVEKIQREMDHPLLH